MLVASFHRICIPPTEPCPGILLPWPLLTILLTCISCRSLCYRNTLTKFLLTLALSYSPKSCLHCRSHISKPTAVRTTISKHLTLPSLPKRTRWIQFQINLVKHTDWYFMASNLVWFGMLCANVAWWYAVQALHLNSVVHVNINVAWILQVGIFVVKWCSAMATFFFEGTKDVVSMTSTKSYYYRIEFLFCKVQVNRH